MNNSHTCNEKQKPSEENIYLFYDEINKKRNLNDEMRIQTDQEFEQNKIKKLNKKYTVQMFSTKIRGGKTFAPKQKTMEFTKLLCKSKAIERRLRNRKKPKKLIQKATNYSNKTRSAKYSFA